MEISRNLLRRGPTASSCFCTDAGVEDAAPAGGAGGGDVDEAATADAEDADVAKSSKRVVATSSRLMRLASEWNSDMMVLKRKKKKEGPNVFG